MSIGNGSSGGGGGGGGSPAQVLKGDYNYTDAGGEQTVIEVVTTTMKILYGALIDLVNMTQNGTIRVYFSVNGNPYSLAFDQLHNVTFDNPVEPFNINLGITDNFKITYEEETDETADRLIPYSIVYEVKE